jgi:cytosine/adenosine deaminase-related metal-dependent hydrolase
MASSSPVKPEAGSVECDLLIRNGYVVSLDADRRIFPNGAVAVGRGLIVGVGTDREISGRFRPRTVLDARGSAVHPGFVDAHVHVTQHSTRGAFPDNLGFGNFTPYYTYWWNTVDDEDEYAGTLLACLEMVRNGITCFMEAGGVLEPNAAAAAVEAVGVRASLGDPLLWDVGQHAMATADHAVIKRAPPDRQRALKLLGSQLWRNRNADSLVRGHVALFGVGSASDELERAAKACADEHHAVLSQHQSFKSDDVAGDDARFGRHPLLHFAEAGVLGPNCAFTHMNIIRDDEVAAVTESKMSLIWCPAGSMNWGVGATSRGRMPELYQQGSNVALGSDSAKFGTTPQGVFAYLLARDRGGAQLGVEDVLEMSTLGGARAMGLQEQIGSLEPGKRADIVVRSADVPEAHPRLNPVQNLILAARSKSVDTVIIDGRIVVKGGHSTLLDEEAVYQRFRESTERILQRLGIRPDSKWPVIE